MKPLDEANQNKMVDVFNGYQKGNGKELGNIRDDLFRLDQIMDKVVEKVLYRIRNEISIKDSVDVKSDGKSTVNFSPPTSIPLSSSNNTNQDIKIQDECKHRTITRQLILASLMKITKKEPAYIDFSKYTLKFKCNECERNIYINVVFIGKCFRTGKIHLEYRKSTASTQRKFVINLTKTLIERKFIDSAANVMKDFHDEINYNGNSPTISKFDNKYINTEINHEQQIGVNREKEIAMSMKSLPALSPKLF